MRPVRLAIVFVVALTLGAACSGKGHDSVLGFYALDSRTGATLWHSSTITELVRTPAGLAGTIGPNVVASLDGQRPPRPRWRFMVPRPGEGTDTSPIVQPLVADDHNVYVVGGNTRVYALDAATGRQVWRSEPLVQEYARLGAGGDGVYFVDDHRALHALGAATGAPRWVANETACVDVGQCAIPAATPPFVVDGQVFFPGFPDATTLLGFDLASGQRTSTRSTPPDADPSTRVLDSAGTASFELGKLVARNQVGSERWVRDFGAHDVHFEAPDDFDVVYVSVEPPPPPED